MIAKRPAEERQAPWFGYAALVIGAIATIALGATCLALLHQLMVEQGSCLSAIEIVGPIRPEVSTLTNPEEVP